MNSLLQKILKKRGIEDVTKLTPEEAAIFDRWEKTLAVEEVTVEKIALFCMNQIGLIEAQMRNLDNTVEKNNRLVIAHSTYRALLGLIEGKNSEKESLEKYLISLTG